MRISPYILILFLLPICLPAQILPQDSIKAQMAISTKQLPPAVVTETGEVIQRPPLGKTLLYVGGGIIVGGVTVYLLLPDKEEPMDDNLPPEAVCQDLTLELMPDETVTIQATMIDNGSFDSDGTIVSLELSDNSFTSADEGSNSVSLTVTDDDGDEDVCTTNVMVIVADPPTAACADLTVNLDENGSATISSEEVDDNSFDPDGTITDMSISISQFDCNQLGPNAVTLTVVDDDGLSDDCEGTVTVVDDLQPEVQCPSNQQVETDPGSCDAEVQIALPNYSDNCTVSEILNDYTGTENASGTYPAGTTTVTYTVSDPSGNDSTCSFEVVVEETEDPEVTCPEDISISTDPDVCEAQVEIPPIQTSDNCGTPALTNDFNGTEDPSGIYPLGETEVVVTATDASGNEADCSFIVTVEDAEAPLITCPDDISVETEVGLCSASVEVPEIEVTENCGTANLTNDYNGTSDPSDTYPVGVSVVTITAEDATGNNSNCSFQITVTDNQNPEITCPESIEVQAPTGTTVLFVTVPQPTVSDNCGLALLTNNITGTNNASGLYPVGATIVEWTVLDIYGNSSSCTHDVTVLEGAPCDVFLTAEVVDYPSDSLSANGTAVVDVFSATPPLTILVNGSPVGTTGATSFMLTGFPLGVYDVQVVDANECFSNSVILVFDQVGLLSPTVAIAGNTIPGLPVMTPTNIEGQGQENWQTMPVSFSAIWYTNQHWFGSFDVHYFRGNESSYHLGGTIDRQLEWKSFSGYLGLGAAAVIHENQEAGESIPRFSFEGLQPKLEGGVAFRMSKKMRVKLELEAFPFAEKPDWWWGLQMEYRFGR